MSVENGKHKRSRTDVADIVTTNVLFRKAD